MAIQEAPKTGQVNESEFRAAVVDLKVLGTKPIPGSRFVVQEQFDIASAYLFEQVPNRREPTTIFTSARDRLEKTIGFYTLAKTAAATQRAREVEKISDVGLQVAKDKLDLLNKPDAAEKVRGKK